MIKNIDIWLTNFLLSIGLWGYILSCILIILESLVPILPLFVFVTLLFYKFGIIFGFIISYINELTLINRDDFINKYISKTSSKIDEYILNSNLLDTITNVIPELDRIYNANSKYKNELFKLLDYYIDLVDSKVKIRINTLDYEEKLILRDKINIICREILSNNNPDDDFKVLVINSYLKYL